MCETLVYDPLNIAYKEKIINHTMYHGVTFTSIGNKYSMFSFFPAMLVGETVKPIFSGFKLPVAGLKTLQFHSEEPIKNTSHLVYCILNQKYTTWDAWNEIVSEAFKQNFILGLIATPDFT